MAKRFDPRLQAALGGVSGVHITPYGVDGAIDLDRLQRIVNDIASAGVDNIVTGGNTGEFAALTLEEIRQSCRAAVAATGKRRVVTAGVGRSLIDACGLAESAAAAGADMVMLHQPPDPFQSPSGALAYVHRLADASPLPVVLYLRQDPYGATAFADLIAHPNVIGVKYASPDLARFAARVAAADGTGVAMICGLAEIWAGPFHAAGATGFTSGLVNVLPALSLAVRDALQVGDHAGARAQVRRLAPFEAMRARQDNGNNVTVVKAAMRLLGQEVGNVRPPGTVTLGTDELTELADLLRSWGMAVVGSTHTRTQE